MLVLDWKQPAQRNIALSLIAGGLVAITTSPPCHLAVLYR